MKITNRKEYLKRVDDYTNIMTYWGFDMDQIHGDEETIREMEERIKYIWSYWRDIEDWHERSKIRLVHSDNSIEYGERRGFCSPIKDDAIREFERTIQEVFESKELVATTQWPYNNEDAP